MSFIPFIDFFSPHIATDDRIFSPDAVDRLMKNTLPIQGHTYNICKNGCKIFKVDDENDDTCDHYGENRHESEDSL